MFFIFGKVYSATVYGIDGILVTVEADISDGLPSFDMVGVLSSEVKEARERVRTALKNSGFHLPPKRVTVNLSPADLRKSGSGFDFPIAIAILCALGLFPAENLKKCMLCGELSLDGRLCPVSGVLPAVFTAREKGLCLMAVPVENLPEAQAVEGVRAVGLRTLKEAAKWLSCPEQLPEQPVIQRISEGNEADWDFCEIAGQSAVKRAAEIAAAGMHNLLCVGPPGTGKTMVAKRLPGILPPMDQEEMLEVTKIYSVCGLLDSDTSLIRKRPFRSPHHTISTAALTGGGSIPKPGEITLAHKGVLFLDELPEFSRTALESLRQPLEDRELTISRVRRVCHFPADFLFCAAMNPCKCGYYPDRTQCCCTDSSIRNYRSRVSRPLLDRLDLIVEVPKLNYEEWKSGEQAESSAMIRARVEAACQTQRERFYGMPIRFNGQMSGKQVKQYCLLGKKEEGFMEQIFQRMEMSPRHYDRVLKVARTIADLEGVERIREEHLSEAVFYRSMAEKYWKAPEL